jgi:hypothetical protein
MPEFNLRDTKFSMAAGQGTGARGTLRDGIGSQIRAMVRRRSRRKNRSPRFQPGGLAPARIS